MKPIFFLFIFVLALSCQTNYHAGKVIEGRPSLAILTNENSNGILIAETNNRILDPIFQESCLQGLQLNIESQTNLKIADNIVLNAYPSVTILNELKEKYQVDGLLMLTKLKVQKKAYDVPGNEIEYIDNRMPEPFFEIIGERIKPWTNLYAQITSKWRYYDLNSGRRYDFEVKNKKVFEFGKYVSDTDFLYEEYPNLLDPLFYQNGKMMVEKLLNNPVAGVDL